MPSPCCLFPAEPSVGPSLPTILPQSHSQLDSHLLPPLLEAFVCNIQLLPPSSQEWSPTASWSYGISLGPRQGIFLPSQHRIISAQAALPTKGCGTGCSDSFIQNMLVETSLVLGVASGERNKNLCSWELPLYGGSEALSNTHTCQHT